MSHATSQIDSHRDERLAALLAEVSQKQARQQPIDWQAVGQEYPDLVDELRQLLAVGEIIDILNLPSEFTLDHKDSRPTLSTREARDVATGLPRTLGDYELREEIGRGGMGLVFKAWDRTLQRFVALKTVLRGEHATPTDLGRFRSEAQAAAGLAHPNIVPVFQVGEESGQAYFCMKYVEGQTLAALIKHGPLAPRRAARYLAAIARGVEHAHQKGILHRDLKPSNVLLGADDQPLVTDFGLAKRVEGGVSLTGTGAIVGTPSYMAPEQAMGEPAARPAADVYSLGAILYEMLTGRPPFLAATAVDTLLLVRSEEPVRPRLLNPRIDADLEFVCCKCLEKRPEHRYASAGQLAADLDAFLQGEAVSARSSSLVYFVNRLFRETHHAPVLENWGGLWMWHSLQILVLCGVTTLMHALGVTSHVPFMLLWSIGLVLWGTIFWNLRRRGGPVTFVERQIAHFWAGGVIGAIATFWIEVFLGLPVLQLTPTLSVASGMIFLAKAGTLSGWFYVPAALAFLMAIPMALIGPPYSPLLFGLVSALGFFVPGLKYYRQRLRGEDRFPP